MFVTETVVESELEADSALVGGERPQRRNSRPDTGHIGIKRDQRLLLVQIVGLLVLQSRDRQSAAIETARCMML